MRKLHIIMIGPHPNAMGGMAAVVAGYLMGPLREQVVIDYIVSYVDGGFSSKLLTAAKALIQLVAKLACGRGDAVHIHSATKGSFMRKAIFTVVSKCFSKPVVFHVHSGEFISFYNRSPVWMKKGISMTLEAANVVVGLSQHWREKLSKIAPRATIAVVPNGVSVPDYEKNYDNPSYFLFLGRVVQRKGVYDILRALADCSNSELRVVFAGGGELEGVAEVASELGVSQQVTLLPWITGKEKERLLEGATALLLPSYAEGLPMAILEAMALGLPVIATAVGGIPEVVLHEVHGILVEPGNVGELKSAMQRLYEDAYLRRRLGMAGRKRVQESFSSCAVVDRLMSVYYRTLETRGRMGKSL